MPDLLDFSAIPLSHARHELTKLFLRHIRSFKDPHLLLNSVEYFFVPPLPIGYLGLIKADIRFAQVVSVLVATQAKHSVFGRHSAVASLSGTNAMVMLRIEEFVPALGAAETMNLFTYPGDRGGSFPAEYISALSADTLHNSLISSFL
jgi:hypothetical protein